MTAIDWVLQCVTVMMTVSVHGQQGVGAQMPAGSVDRHIMMLLWSIWEVNE